MYAPPVNRLITELARLPGIGQRTAQRLAFHILRMPPEDVLPLAEAIREVKETVGHAIDNHDLESKGKIENMKGKVQKKIGQIEKVLEK